MDPLMVLMKAILRDYFLDNNWDIIMVNCLALMKALLNQDRNGWGYTSWSWGGCSAVLGAIQRVKVRS